MAAASTERAKALAQLKEKPAADPTISAEPLRHSRVPRVRCCRKLLFGAAVRNGRKVPVPARPYRCSKSSSGSSCKRALDDLASLPDGIEVVAPPLRHTHPLIPVLAAVIDAPNRSEEHTSELQSLMRISYAVFCLKK